MAQKRQFSLSDFFGKKRTCVTKDDKETEKIVTRAANSIDFQPSSSSSSRDICKYEFKFELKNFIFRVQVRIRQKRSSSSTQPLR